jgi:hypothetical protein
MRAYQSKRSSLGYRYGFAISGLAGWFMLIFNAILDLIFFRKRQQQEAAIQQALFSQAQEVDKRGQEIVEAARDRVLESYKQNELKAQSRSHMSALWQREYQAEKDRLLSFLNDRLPAKVGAVVSRERLQEILSDFEFTALFSLRDISDDKNYHALETADGKFDVSFVAEPSWCLCQSEEDTKSLMKELGFRSGLFKPDDKSPAQRGFKRW